jgi:acyl-CoA synthetase (AMP-forming)/AMP-acid ligase II
MVLCQSRFHQALLVTAGLAAGLVVYPVDDQMPPRSIDALRRQVAPELLVLDRGTAALATPEVATVTAEDLLEAIPTAAGALRDPAPTGGLLVYTSGATGVPKAVLLDELQIGANVEFAMGHFGYGPGWVSASVLPHFHTFSLISDLLPSLCSLGSVVICKGLAVQDVGTFTKACADWGVRSFSAVPIIFDTLVAVHAKLPSSLRFAISGAAPLSERTRTRYASDVGHPIIPCYGLTETVCFATASPQNDVRPGSAGRPAGIEVRIFRGDLQPLPPHTTGEIALRGASVTTGGYKFGPPGAADAFLDDGWFMTGDVGYLDDDGYLHITGRLKNMLIRGGNKLYLEDLDACLQAFPGVTDACSIAVRGPGDQERAIAFVVPRQGTVDREALVASCREALGVIGQPDEVLEVERIPRSATGKPLRESLKITYAKGHAQ